MDCWYNLTKQNYPDFPFLFVDARKRGSRWRNEASEANIFLCHSLIEPCILVCLSI